MEEREDAKQDTAQKPAEMTEREDAEMFFRSMMQYLRHLAKKYGFTIKQWPEK